MDLAMLEIGTKFGRWTVVSKLLKEKKGGRWFHYLMCRCDCGNERKVLKHNLLKKKTISCGCYALECKSTHSMSRTRIYTIYRCMKRRCEDKKDKHYKYYGARGIKCQWKSFEDFYKDMFGRYKENLTLERIKNNAGYSKSNCRWVSMGEQARNRSSNVKYKGECSVDASKRLGGNKCLVLGRIRHGWSLKKAFTQKIK